MNLSALIAVVVLFFVPLSAYADDFKIETSCNSGKTTLAISNTEGKPVHDATVRTIKELTGMRGFEQKYFSNESGLVEIQYGENTGFVWLQKGGYNDQKFKINICSLNEVPVWIKTNAQWWIEGKITEDAFIEGIQYLAKHNIIKIPKASDAEMNTATYDMGNTGERIPEWVAINVEWWIDGIINDDTFLQGMQYLVINRVIDLSEKQITDNFVVDANLPSLDALRKFGIDKDHHYDIKVSSNSVCSTKVGNQATRGLEATDFTERGVLISASICKFDTIANSQRGILGSTPDDDELFQTSSFLGKSDSAECFMEPILQVETGSVGWGGCRYGVHLILVTTVGLDKPLNNEWSADTISGLMDEMLKKINKMKGTNHIPFNEIVSYNTNSEPINQVGSNSITPKNSSNKSFEINIISCKPTSGENYFEVNYGIKNNLTEDYTLDIQVLLLDATGNVVEIDRTYADTKAGRTIYDDHLVDYNYRATQCEIEIVEALPAYP